MISESSGPGRPCELIREILPARGGESPTVVINPMVGVSHPDRTSAMGGALGACGARNGHRPEFAAVTLRGHRYYYLPRGFANHTRALSSSLATPANLASASQHDAGPLRGRSRGQTFPANGFRISSSPMGGLALVNLIVPLVILRLATRTRVWGVRLLLALPVLSRRNPGGRISMVAGIRGGKIDGALAVLDPGTLPRCPPQVFGSWGLCAFRGAGSECGCCPAFCPRLQQSLCPRL